MTVAVALAVSVTASVPDRALSTPSRPTPRSHQHPPESAQSVGGWGLEDGSRPLSGSAKSVGSVSCNDRIR
jgi:hypothetical protein